MTEEIVFIKIASRNYWCNKYKTRENIFLFVRVRGNGWSITYKNEDYGGTQPTVLYSVVCIFFISIVLYFL